jgi:hypothetical protein
MSMDVFERAVEALWQAGRPILGEELARATAELRSAVSEELAFDLGGIGAKRLAAAEADLARARAETLDARVQTAWKVAEVREQLEQARAERKLMKTQFSKRCDHLADRAEAAEAALARARELIAEAYECSDEWPSNRWLQQAEDLGAWPRAALVAGSGDE